MGVHENLTGAQRAARYRAAKRAQGLRLKQIWVWDLRNPRVREEIRREVEEINRRDREQAGLGGDCWGAGDGGESGVALARAPPQLYVTCNGDS